MHTDPLAAGFSQAKLDKLVEHLDTRYVQPGKIPGCRVLVSRRGVTALSSTLGKRDIERNKPMRRGYDLSYLLHVKTHHLDRTDDVIRGRPFSAE